MDHGNVFDIIDLALQAAACLIAFGCIKNIFSALRNKFVYINGKKATKVEEPVGYWLVIISWLALFSLFMHFAITGN